MTSRPKPVPDDLPETAHFHRDAIHPNTDPSLPPLRDGMTLGPLRLDHTLARSATSVLYRAHHTELDRPVVAKILKGPFTGPDSPHTRRLRHEAELAPRLAHPRIVRVLGDHSFDGHTVLLSEFVPGANNG